MIGNKIEHRLDPYLHSLVKKLFGNRGNPNLFTLMGFFSALGASVLIIQGRWFLSGLAILISGLFDLFDGVVARTSGKVTPFGGFLDSVLDRYSDLFILAAVLIFYLRRGDSTLVVLSALVSIGTALIPYVRARAEAAGTTCSAGLMERAERMILLAIGALFCVMEPVLWILGVLTHYTVIERICHVHKKLSKER